MMLYELAAQASKFNFKRNHFSLYKQYTCMPSIPPTGHTALIRDMDPVRWQENAYGKGITPFYTQNGEVAKIVFNPALIRENAATEWLTRQKYVPLHFIPANEEPQRENAAVREISADKPRTLSISFRNPAKIERLEGGGMMVYGVRMLDPGTWTDSATKTPLNYGVTILNRDANQWIDNALWSRHLGGVPRRVGERVGDIRNYRPDDGVVADLYLHGHSQDSRDTMEMIEAGDVDYVSVEHGGTEKWNPTLKQYEAESIFFTGAAVVHRGACATCTIRNNEAPALGGEMRENEVIDASDTLEQNLQQLHAALTAHLGLKYNDGSEKEPHFIATTEKNVIYSESWDSQYFRIPYVRAPDGVVTFGGSTPVEKQTTYKDTDMELADVEKIVRELSDAVKLQTETITALSQQLNDLKGIEGRVKALEGDPNPKGDHSSDSSGAGVTRDLEAPKRMVIRTTEGYSGVEF